MLVECLLLAWACFPALQGPPPQGPPAVEVESAEAETGAKVEPSPLLARIAVIGASFSNGTGLEAELEVSTPLARVVDVFHEGQEKPADHQGSFLFFSDPVGIGRRKAEAARASNPSLVIGIDFLFWYAYGAGLSSQQRSLQLETGLKQLESFECPLLIGDIPDMSVALTGYSQALKGPLIHRGMIPSADQRAQMNRRIREWAATRPLVTVAPLAEFVSRVQRGEPLELRGAILPGGSFESLIQQDKLHPTVDGAIALLVMTFDTLVEAHEELRAEHVLWDRALLRERLFTATAEGREASRARRARSEARRERMRKLREKREARDKDKDKDERDGGEPRRASEVPR